MEMFEKRGCPEEGGASAAATPATPLNTAASPPTLDTKSEKEGEEAPGVWALIHGQHPAQLSPTCTKVR